MIESTKTNNKKDSNLKQTIKLDPKQKRDPRANHFISDEKKMRLQELFLMDGITPYQAARVADVKFETAKRYFEMWSEELVDDPQYETWVQRQRRVRVRSLEGYTKKIIPITEQRNTLEKIVANLTFRKNKKKELKIKNSDDLDHGIILAYIAKIAVLNQQLIELQDRYDAVDSQPPAVIILQKEMADMLNEIQSGAGVR